jgi:glycosyltransferase involved in cell wall biosynthesis
MLAAKLAGVKIRLHTVAGLPLMESTGIKRTVLNQVEKLTYNAATKVYPNSQGLYDFILKEKLGKADKIKVIGNGSSNGIDVNHFDPALFSDADNQNLKKQLGISETDFVFIFVGRMVKDKGINELIGAFKTLQGSSNRTIKLLLVGPLEQDLDPLSQDVLDEIEGNPDIISVGFQKDVRSYFAISSCLAFPSYREGFPNVVLQALAMGIPALVSNINGCNEIVENYHNGLIFPPKDENALQIAMKKILDMVLYNQIQSVSRTSIMKYKQEVIWELLKENYDTLLNS